MSELALSAVPDADEGTVVSLREFMDRLVGEFAFVTSLAQELDASGHALAAGGSDAAAIRRLQNVDLIVQATQECRDVLGRIAAMVDARLTLPVEPLVAPIKIDGIKQRLSAGIAAPPTPSQTAPDIEMF